MEKIVIYCKSFSKDLRRVIRLTKSIEEFNRDNIPFYLSVPEEDIDLFHKHIKGYSVNLIKDESILAESFKSIQGNPEEIVSPIPGFLMQQIVKTEFWRTGCCANYLVIDSDSYFIKPFSTDDFFIDDIPYTVMHECKELLQFAARSGRKKIKRDYVEARELYKSIYNRKGPFYDFGPPPLIWSCLVWEDLSKSFAETGCSDIFEMIIKYPGELMIYGEHLLHSKIIPVIPIEPMFKFYHYKEQYEEGKRIGENEKVIAENFFGIVMQSNWDRSMDFEEKKPSRFWKFFKSP